MDVSICFPNITPWFENPTKKVLSALQVMTMILVGIGLVFVLIFHCGAKEPSGELDKKMSTSSANVVEVT